MDAVIMFIEIRLLLGQQYTVPPNKFRKAQNLVDGDVPHN